MNIKLSFAGNNATTEAESTNNIISITMTLPFGGIVIMTPIASNTANIHAGIMHHALDR